MPLAVILALCMGGIVCLTPVTLYLFWLAFVNKRDRPTVASGSGDFVAMLVGLSGFLACGSYLFLTGVMRWVNGWPTGGLDQLRHSWGQDRVTWIVVVCIYCVVGAAAVGGGLLGRRRSLVAYNLDPAAAAVAVETVFAEMKLAARRTGNLYSDGRGLVELVPFHLFQNVTVKLLPHDPRLCEELDRRLRIAFAAAPAADNPAGPWIVTTAVTGFGLVLGCVGLIVVGTIAGK